LLSHANPSGNLSVVVERALDLLIAQQQSRQFGVTQRPRSHRSAKQTEDSLARTGGTVATAMTEATEAAASTRATEAAASTRATEAAASTRATEAAASTRATEAAASTRATEAAATRADEECRPENDSIRTESRPGGRLGHERTKSVLRSGPRAHISNEIRRQLLERDSFCCTYTSPTGQRCQCRRFLQIHHEKAWAKGGPDTLENLRLLCAEHNRLLGELEFGQRPEQVPA
jgi:5-methylcytosine-specific restriction endonuclease McrA